MDKRTQEFYNLSDEEVIVYERGPFDQIEAATKKYLEELEQEEIAKRATLATLQSSGRLAELAARRQARK